VVACVSATFDAERVTVGEDVVLSVEAVRDDAVFLSSSTVPNALLGRMIRANDVSVESRGIRIPVTDDDERDLVMEVPYAATCGRTPIPFEVEGGRTGSTANATLDVEVTGEVRTELPDRRVTTDRGASATIPLRIDACRGRASVVVGHADGYRTGGTVVDDGDGTAVLRLDTSRAGRDTAFSAAGDDDVRDAFVEERHWEQAMPAGEYEIVLRGGTPPSTSERWWSADGPPRRRRRRRPPRRPRHRRRVPRRRAGSVRGSGRPPFSW